MSLAQLSPIFYLYFIPMVAIRTGVVNMYPSLYVDKVVNMLEDKIKKPAIKWIELTLFSNNPATHPQTAKFLSQQ